MASTTFTDGSSVIFSSWLNDVNTAVYNGVFPNGGLSLINLSVSGTVSGTGFTNLVNNSLSAPGPIGSVTPNTGIFTTLTATSPIAISSGGTGLTSVGTSGYPLASNGTGLTYKKLGLGMTGETWHDVTVSRALGTTYTNSNSYPIFVSIICNGSPASATLTIGSIQIQENATSVSGYAAYSVTGIVPPGVTYSASGGTALASWAELY